VPASCGSWQPSAVNIVRNLAANPQVTIELRTSAGVVERFDGTAATTTAAERDRLLAILASAWPDTGADLYHQPNRGLRETRPLPGL
jgi:hypothetical protein